MRKFVCFTGLILVLVCAGSAMAQEVPWSELALGYCAVTNNGSGTSGAGFAGNKTTIALHGFCGSVSGNLHNWIGIVADIGANRLNETGVSGNLFTYLFGPRISINHGGRFTPFGQVLLGGARLRATVAGNPAANPPTVTISTDFNSFAMTVGGGLDFKLSEHIGVRVAQAEYLMTRFNNTRQNNGRFGGGLIIRFGKRPS